MFVILEEFEHRHGASLSGDAIAASCAASISDASRMAAWRYSARPPSTAWAMQAVQVMVRDRNDQGLEALQRAADELAEEGNKKKGLVGLIDSLRADTPQMFVEVDRTKCKTLGIALNDVFLTLQIYLGGYYVNDINRFGRTWQVNLQAIRDRA